LESQTEQKREDQDFYFNFMSATHGIEWELVVDVDSWAFGNVAQMRAMRCVSKEMGHQTFILPNRLFLSEKDCGAGQGLGRSEKDEICKLAF
jgi:hypothetical protein